MVPAKVRSATTQSMVVFGSFTLVLLVADLATKQLAFAKVAGVPIDPANPGSIPHHDAVVVVPYLLSLKLTTNIGAIFGMGKGWQWLFVAVSIMAIGAILRIFWRHRSQCNLLHVALAFVLAGALGNLYDRLRYHAVRDMLFLFPDVNLPFGLKWPGGDDQIYPWIFNVADASLLIGVGLLLIISWRKPETSDQ